MGESYITAGGYFNLNLNAGSDPDFTGIYKYVYLNKFICKVMTSLPVLLQKS